MPPSKLHTYLSVDLDYWGMSRSTQRLYKAQVSSYIDRILSLNVPVHVVGSHEEILTYINKYKIKRIINIDYHSDIANEGGELHLCDGTWANFYKYRDECIFEWRHPMKSDSLFFGRCDDMTASKWTSIPTKYKRIEAAHSLRGLTWDNIGEVCIAISPDYLEYDMSWLGKKYEIFKGWL